MHARGGSAMKRECTVLATRPHQDVSGAHHWTRIASIGGKPGICFPLAAALGSKRHAVEVPERTRVPEQYKEGKKGAPSEGKGPPRESLRTDDGDLCSDRAVEEAAGDRVHEHAGIEAAESIGEKAVVGDRQADQDRPQAHYTVKPRETAGRPREGKPSEDPKGGEELQ